MFKKYLLSTLFALTTLFSASASQYEAARASLLTCGPGTAVYSLFGHTAIRITIPTQGVDYVFNYGLFDFDTPHFIYRFVKGETDYQFGRASYADFCIEYTRKGIYVDEQVLNLTPDEIQELWALLRLNYIPKHRTYRYNYFFDNCTTRARDKIEACFADSLVYNDVAPEVSFRDIVHQYTEDAPWTAFGIDFCLGAEADRKVTQREWGFIPFHLQKQFDNAVLLRGDSVMAPLTISSMRILHADKRYQKESTSFPLSPIVLMWSIAALFMALAIYELRQKKHLWGVDVCCFLIQGVVGILVAFLFFFSVHPTVGSNYLILLFNPLPILYLPLLIKLALEKHADYYYYVYGTVVALVLLLWGVIPQHFHPAVFPLALVLLSRFVVGICRMQRL